MRKNQVENSRDRRALAREAGLGSVSWISVLAGALAAYGLTAVLLAIAGGIAAAVNSGSNFSNVSWSDLKAGTGIIVGVILFVSYVFGGYVAGRMARRSGHLNGLAVFFFGVLLALAVGLWVKLAGGGSSITTTLRNVGAPTTWHEWRDVGTVAGIASLAGMLIGSMVGGVLGERWHSKLLARAMDPNLGPEAEQRAAAERAAEAEAAAAEQREAAERAAATERQAAAERAAAAEQREAERRATTQQAAEEREAARREGARGDGAGAAPVGRRDEQRPIEPTADRPTATEGETVHGHSPDQVAGEGRPGEGKVGAAHRDG
jgi:hypothetical protein